MTSLNNSSLKYNRPRSTLKRTGFRQPTYEEALQRKRVADQKKALNQSSKIPKNVESKKNTPRKNGLKGIGTNNIEKAFHGRVASLGCIACLILKMHTGYPIRIHHTDGRKQSLQDDYSEWQVLPLCDQHHRPDICFAIEGLPLDQNAPSVHTRKKLFVEQVGNEKELVLLVYQMLEESPPWVVN
jgi:hypothetical protein